MLSNDDIEIKIRRFADIVATELTHKLRTILNSPVKVNYSRIVDPLTAGRKVTVNKNSILFSSSINRMKLGLMSIIMSEQQALQLSRLIIKDQVPIEDINKISGEELNAFIKCLDDLIISIVNRLKQIDQQVDLNFTNLQHRTLDLSREESLMAPASGVEEPIGLGFLVEGLHSDVETTLHIELNSETLETLVQTINISKVTNDFFEIVGREYGTFYEEAKDKDNKNKGKITKSKVETVYKIDEGRNLNFLKDSTLELILELGRAEMTFKEVLRLTKGSAIQLDRNCKQPVDLYIHNQLVAKGEVVAVDETFGFKITELVGNLDLAKDLVS
jgi:flagellar motor switch protein FliN